MRFLAFFAALHAVTAAVTITGYIYCDNYFEFYFNGQLIKKDPLTFTPHNAVKVSFTWDGTSPKVYAIMCQDFATASGYEYTSSPASTQLGDGALIAEFDDGTVTTNRWKTYTVTHGPTAESEAAGCRATNLYPCVIKTYTEPTAWYATTFNDSSWSAATVYTEAEAGWGTTPVWNIATSTCCTPTSPLTRLALTACNRNWDLASGREVAATVTADDCLSPRAVLSSYRSSFLWGTNLKKDNRLLFRYTVSPTTTTTTTTAAATSTTTVAATTTTTTATVSNDCKQLLVGSLSCPQPADQKVKDMFETAKSTDPVVANLKDVKIISYRAQSIFGMLYILEISYVGGTGYVSITDFGRKVSSFKVETGTQPPTGAQPTPIAPPVPNPRVCAKDKDKNCAHWVKNGYPCSSSWSKKNCKNYCCKK